MLIAWKPHGPGNFLCEGAERRAMLGAIKGTEGQKLDPDAYFALLGDRVQEMLDAEEDPENALDQLYKAFDDENLAQVPKPSLDRVGSKLIFANGALRGYFDSLDLPGKLPGCLEKSDPSAARVIEVTGLQSWMTNLFTKPYDAGR
jgi:hypothetical protein